MITRPRTDFSFDFQPDLVMTPLDLSRIRHVLQIFHYPATEYTIFQFDSPHGDQPWRIGALKNGKVLVISDNPSDTKGLTPLFYDSLSDKVVGLDREEFEREMRNQEVHF